MTPQAIVEEEEVERVKALLRRENLIRGLGIVDQLTRLLRNTEPKPVEVQRPHINISESQVCRCCFQTPKHTLGGKSWRRSLSSKGGGLEQTLFPAFGGSWVPAPALQSACLALRLCSLPANQKSF